MGTKRIALSVAVLLGASSAVFAQVPHEPPPAEKATPAPAREAAPPQAAAPPSAAAPSAAGDYVVAQGDTLAEIAQKLTGDAANWEAIAHENGIDDPTKLQVGMHLRIPATLRSS
jgi:nucleoid-associated protein YgaU